MATAEELLMDEQCDDILIVDLESRQIVIPGTVTNLGVESDDSVRVLHFRVPRQYCEIDLSTFDIRINYKHSSGVGGSYSVKDSIVDSNMINFDWVVDRQATAKKGDVLFNVCLREIVFDVAEREFNTAIATLPVLEGLGSNEEYSEIVHDFIEQWRDSLIGSGDSILQDITNTGDAAKEEVRNASDEEISRISSSGSRIVAGIESAGDSAVRRISNSRDVVLQDIAESGSDVIGDISGARGSAVSDISGARDDALDELDSAHDDAIRDISRSVNAFIEANKDSLTGPAGETITSIKRTSGTSAPGTVDTYTITTSANKTYTFTVYNGADGVGGGGGTSGKDGVGIQNITFKEKTEEGNVYTVLLTNGGSYEIIAPEGDMGPQGEPGASIAGPAGDDGVGIQNITFKEKTEEGNVYTIRLTNGTSYEIIAPEGDMGPQGEPGASVAGPAGKDGVDGYTPIKGRDYFTEADKQELVQAVLEALPVAEEARF